MASSTRREWSPEYTGHTERRNSGPYRAPARAPASTLTFHAGRCWAQLQPGEKKQTEEAEDQKRIEVQRPSNGRTVLGRRVEKPADVKPAGPSGQRDVAQHDRKHTNK